MKVWVDLLLLCGAILLAPSFGFAAEGPATSALLSTEIEKPRKWSGDWNFAMLGISTEEGKDAGGAAALYGSARFDWRFTRMLHAKISPSVSLFSSRMQERYDDDSFQNRIWLYEGYLSLEPLKYFEARAGALNQRYHGTSMLVSGLRSFPGAQVIGKLPVGGDFEADLVLQRVVPTSHSLNTERENEEELPLFTTETLLLKGKTFGWLKWNTSLGHFRWSNIPAKVVFESRRIGNEGLGENIPGSVYRYAHEGYYGAGEFCLCTDNAVNFTVEYERIHNTEAASDAADAQLIGAGPNFNFGDYELDIRYRRYFIESDATVAYYNKSKMGNTNRIGDYLEVQLHFKKEDFWAFAEAYQADPINTDPNQRDLRLYLIGVATDYAKF
jgi:hypothetical protein